MKNTLVISSQFSQSNAFTWICSVIFGRFLNFQCQYTDASTPGVVLTLPNQTKIHLNDYLFQIISSEGLSSNALPHPPIQYGSLFERSYPVLFGNTTSQVDKENIFLDFDLVGTCFFLMACIEEQILIDSRDKFGRFPFSSSILRFDDLIKRPIVDEYIELLEQCIEHLAPGLNLKGTCFNLISTIDVDHAVVNKNAKVTIKIRSLLKNFKLNREIKPWLSELTHYIVGKDNFKFDNNLNAIKWISEKNKKRGLSSYFFFMGGASNKKYDSGYSLDSHAIQNTMHLLYQDKHNIGIHPSFETYLDINQYQREFDRLNNIINSIGYGVNLCSVRQHYLRWHVNKTPPIQEKIGLTKDFTLGFAEVCGFKCGTSKSYPWFDFKRNKSLDLEMFPLIVMETTLFSKNYMSLSRKEAVSQAIDLKGLCERYRGNFVILWHNNNLQSEKDKSSYLEIIDS